MTARRLIATLVMTACAGTVERSPPVSASAPCGSHIECYNRSLLNLAEAQKLLDAAMTQGLKLVPPGSVVAYVGATEPAGWLICDGRELDKNNPLYQPLFEVIGTTYGGDANPKFKLPDYRGVFLRGLDGGAGRDPDERRRVRSGLGSFQDDLIGLHSHEVRGVFLEASGGRGFNGIGLETNSSPPNPRNFPYVTASGGPETRPKNVAVNFMIKL